MPARLALIVCVALAASAARAADLDPYLPGDTERYLAVHVKQILTSPAGKKLGPDFVHSLIENLEPANALLKELGVDARKDIERIQLASPASLESDRGLLIIAGVFDEDKLKKKADDGVNEATPRVKSHKVGLGGGEFQAIYEVKPAGQDAAVFVAVLGNKTLLASGGKDYVVDALRQAKAGRKPALKDAQTQAVLEKLDAKLGVAVVTRGGALPKLELLALLPRHVREGLDSIEVLGGGVAFTNEVKFELVGSSKTAEDAAALRETATRGLALAQVGLKFLGSESRFVNLLTEVLNTVKAGGKGKVVTLSAKLSADVLDDFNKKE